MKHQSHGKPERLQNLSVCLRGAAHREQHRDGGLPSGRDRVSSIVMVAYQVVEIDDVAGGLLYYVAQSFLLAGSIFGLDQYLRIIRKHYHEKPNE